jgi:hypothetical protein
MSLEAEYQRNAVTSAGVAIDEATNRTREAATSAGEEGTVGSCGVASLVIAAGATLAAGSPKWAAICNASGVN